MPWPIYELRLAECDDGLPHPHAVALSLKKECIVVPSYSHDGYKVNQFIDAMKKKGYREDQIFVELDNAAHVTLSCPYNLKLSRWCPVPIRRISNAVLNTGRLIGDLDDAGALKIVRCILSAKETSEYLLSPNAIKQLSLLEATLAALLAA